MLLHLVWTAALALTLTLSQSAGQESELPKLEWWQTSVFYHLYPRSFKDSNGDGVGDLRGMIDKLPQHLSDLGIGAVWLSPIFKSPMVDFGYDISDYLTFEPVFGDLNDFEILKERLHEKGIKILLDFVPNHTSDQHEWFQKSLAGIPPYDDFYVWVEPKGWNGTEPIPPNNWESVFSGSAWTYAPERKKFYLRQFQQQQPDLNFNNPKVVQAMNDILRYWMDKGVDGFRVDSVGFLFEDAQLRDDPEEENIVVPGSSPVAKTVKMYTKDQPEIYDLLRKWRIFVEEYSSQTDNKTRVLLLEDYASLNHTMQLYFTGGNSMPLNFFFFNYKINASSTAQDYSDVINLWLDNMPAGKWPNWGLDNHDNSRSSSSLGPELVDAISTLLLLLPGTPVLYYGQEIGQEDTDIIWEEVQDPFTLRLGPALLNKVNRDRSRCPLQWSDAVSAGFSSNPRTWLPVNPNFYRVNVEAQKKAEVSHYKIVQRLIRLRSGKVFQYGGVKTFVLSQKVLAFTRFLQGEHLYIVVINLGNFQTTIDLSPINRELTNLLVHTASVNSEYKIGDHIPGDSRFPMRSKSCLVLTTSPTLELPVLSDSRDIEPPHKVSGADRAASHTSMLILMMMFCFISVWHSQNRA